MRSFEKARPARKNTDEKYENQLSRRINNIELDISTRPMPNWTGEKVAAERVIKKR